MGHLFHRADCMAEVQKNASAGCGDIVKIAYYLQISWKQIKWLMFLIIFFYSYPQQTTLCNDYVPAIHKSRSWGKNCGDIATFCLLV